MLLLRCVSLVMACAVKRRRFPVGVSPTRQPLQPEATGTVMEVTKWLKPLVSRHVRHAASHQMRGRPAQHVTKRVTTCDCESRRLASLNRVSSQRKDFAH